jgi:VanZ family protein
MVAVNRLATAGISYGLALLFFNSALVKPAGAELAMALAAVGPLLILAGLRFNVPGSAWALAYPPAVFAAVLLSIGQFGAALVLLLLALTCVNVVTWSLRQDSTDSGKAVWSMGLAVLLACFVAYYSSPQGAPGDLALRIAEFLHVSPAAGEAILIGTRKTVHFIFYGLMGAMAWRACFVASSEVRHAWVFGLSFVLAHALFDEARQALYASRTGSPWDVLLDVAGAAAGIWLIGRRALER